MLGAGLAGRKLGRMGRWEARPGLPGLQRKGVGSLEAEGSGLGCGQWAPEFWAGLEGWRGIGIEQGSGV